MRKNLPVSNNEVELDEDQAIVSKTDLEGNIVYVNPYFELISGFSAAELLGQPQNIIRHPDMPVEAFADLWHTIRAGIPWTGLVKNRCKNGDFYWVKANITPIKENGRTIGYMSVRTKAERHQVAEASRRLPQDRGRRHQPAHQERPDRAPGPGQCGGTPEPCVAGHAHLAGHQRGQRAADRCLRGRPCLPTAPAMPPATAFFGATAFGFLINVFLWYTLRTGMLQPLGQRARTARA